MWKLPENSIVIQSSAGLGNRLLALEGAILLGREINKKVYISWPRARSQLKCRFHDLFEKSEEFKVLFIPVYLRRRRVISRKISDAIYKVYNRNIARYFYNFDVRLHPDNLHTVRRPIDPPTHKEFPSLSELTLSKRILVDTYYRFFPEHVDFNEPYTYVRPKAALRRRVEEIVKQFNGRVVGVHIRRGDVTPQQYRHRYVPDDRYVELMREEIARDPSVRFFLSTERQADREQFKNLFGDRLIIQPDAKDGRNNVEGVKSAVVDMFALAKTDFIVGVGSSFSELAARIGGGVERRVLKGLTSPHS